MSCGPATMVDGAPGGGGGGSPTAGAIQDADGLVLTATNQSFELADADTTGIDWVVGYQDLTVSAAVDGSQQGTTAAATTTVTSSPAASTAREVLTLSFTNIDTVQHVVVFRKNIGGTTRQIATATLEIGESMNYSKRRGWYVMDAQGRELTDSVAVANTANLMGPYGFVSANNATARAVTVGAGAVLCGYLGRCTQRVTTLIANFRVVAGAVGVTWAEAAIATGEPTPGSNPTLTVRGFTNIAATIVGTGIMRIVIPITPGAIARGSGIWVLVGAVVVTTAPTLRCSSFGDELQMCMSASGAAATRPSLIVGTPTVFTTDTTENVPYYWASA